MSLFKSINFCISFIFHYATVQHSSIMGKKRSTEINRAATYITQAQNEQQTSGLAQILGVLGPRIWARPGVFVIHAGQSVISDHTSRCYQQQLPAASQTDLTL